MIGLGSGRIVDDFYNAFARKDAEAMAACYADDAVFMDPVFPRLSGSEVGDMWRMLVSRSTDLEIETVSSKTENDRASVVWQARYTFGPQKRKVHNIVEASIVLKNGKIHRHVDQFDFWRWSRQALGPAGVALGWSPFLRRSVQRTVAGSLAAFRAKRSSARPG